VLFNYLKNSYKYLAFLIIPLAFELTPYHQQKAPLKIKLIQTDIKQDKKWLVSEAIKKREIERQKIDEAIKQNYDVIIFPESFFPLYMNKTPKLINELSKLSKKYNNRNRFTSKRKK